MTPPFLPRHDAGIDALALELVRPEFEDDESMPILQRRTDSAATRIAHPARQSGPENKDAGNNDLANGTADTVTPPTANLYPEKSPTLAGNGLRYVQTELAESAGTPYLDEDEMAFLGDLRDYTPGQQKTFPDHEHLQPKRGRKRG